MNCRNPDFIGAALHFIIERLIVCRKTPRGPRRLNGKIVRRLGRARRGGLARRKLALFNLENKVTLRASKVRPLGAGLPHAAPDLGDSLVSADVWARVMGPSTKLWLSAR